MAQRETAIYLIYPDGFRDQVAVLQGGITGSKEGKNINYALWLIKNAEWLKEIERTNPGTMIEAIDLGGA